MARIDRVRYISWDEFVRSFRVQLFGDSSFGRGRFLFRGLGDAEYELVSSFDRIYPDHPRRQDLFRCLLHAFCEESEGMTDPLLLHDELQASALAQHYGLPTRLLDWTESPYVAAFFALSTALVEPRSFPGHVAVWVLHRDAPVWSAEQGVAVITVPAGANARLRNQEGRFTLAQTPFRSLEEYVENAEYDGVALTQMFFPASEAARGLADLEIMGLKATRLYPDLTGSARAARIRVELEGAEGLAAGGATDDIVPVESNARI